jgi:hypothetical protein
MNNGEKRQFIITILAKQFNNESTAYRIQSFKHKTRNYKFLHSLKIYSQ